MSKPRPARRPPGRSWTWCYKTGYLAGNRAYTNSDPDHFQLPIRALGYQPVYDYRVDHLGIAAQVHGAIQVEGAWYSPAMPTALIDATAHLLAGAIDQATWVKRIDARRSSALAAKEHPDTDGHQRMMCPAAAWPIQCPIKPLTMGRGIHLPLADPQPSPVGAPKVRAQPSITIPPQIGAKHAQPLPYGTPECLLAFQLAHTNSRKIAMWADSQPDPSTGRPKRRSGKRRETKPLKHWTPTRPLRARSRLTGSVS